MTPDSRLIVGMVLWRPQPMMLTNSRRSISEMFRRQVEIRQYYASERSFSPVGVRPVSGRLDGDTDRPELAGLRRSLPTQIEPDAECCGRFEHHLLPPTCCIDWSVDGPSARDWRRPLLFGVALLGAGIALVLKLG